MAGALDDLVVVDLTQNLAGPFCTMLLADLGADVLKIEPIERGDNARGFGPPFVNGESAGFMTLNRNKRSLALDLKADRGREILLRLVERADVLIENFRPGVTARLGIAWEQVRGLRPELVYASISGFGEGSPYEQLGGLDLIAQGMSGIMSITGEGEGRPPVKVGVPITDLSSGMLACVSILAALRHRDRTGIGQRVETSLLDAGLALSVWEASMYLASGRRPEPLGSSHRLSAPYEAFPTRDGWVTVGGANERLWRRLVETLGLPEDDRFAENRGRMEHRHELAELIAARTREYGTDELVAALSAAGIPCGPILGYHEILEHEHVRAREMVVEQEHPVAGPVRVLGVPVKLSETPAAVRTPAPVLGADADAVLAELGYDAAELREDGIVR